MQLTLSEPPSTRPLDQPGPRVPGWDVLTAGPLGWASEPACRGVGHCVERALAEDRLSCRHKQTPVGCLMASQVQRRRPLSGTQLLRKPVFRTERWGSTAALRNAYPFIWHNIFGVSLTIMFMATSMVSASAQIIETELYLVCTFSLEWIKLNKPQNNLCRIKLGFFGFCVVWLYQESEWTSLNDNLI